MSLIIAVATQAGEGPGSSDRIVKKGVGPSFLEVRVERRGGDRNVLGEDAERRGGSQILS